MIIQIITGIKFYLTLKMVNGEEVHLIVKVWTQVITWGGPIALFRWDNIEYVDIKEFSIREIQQPNIK